MSKVVILVAGRLKMLIYQINLFVLKKTLLFKVKGLIRKV